MSKNAVFLLGGKISKNEEFLLPYSDIFRSLISIEKVQPTSKRFPRKAGIPTKEPLK